MFIPSNALNYDQFEARLPPSELLTSEDNLKVHIFGTFDLYEIFFQVTLRAIRVLKKDWNEFSEIGYMATMYQQTQMAKASFYCYYNTTEYLFLVVSSKYN